ncbi:hypothetical protein EDD15DRAFT_2514796 [Pisolithus albus]|nr:hypothetical protein EDD15DRAFT_2514796 [Pisolithus albus]
MASVDLTNTWGASFIGGIVTAVLYGITTLQTYLYFMNYPNDDVPTKLFVAAIWVLDTTHVTLMCHALYYYLVSSYGVTTSLAYGVWSLFVSIQMHGGQSHRITYFPVSLLQASVAVNLTIACAVQAFFTVKIFYLCRPRLRWIVTVPIVSDILISILNNDLIATDHNSTASSWLWHRCAPFSRSTIIPLIKTKETVVLMFIKKQLSSLSQLTYYAITPFGAALVVSDIFIAVALCLLLRENSSLTIFPRTKQLLNILMIYAINRCLLTSLVAIAEVVLWAVNPENSWFMAVDFTIGKLYANSLLASLNSRNFVRRSRNSGDVEFFLNTIHLSGIPESSGDMSTSANNSDKLGRGDHDVLSTAGSTRDIETSRA